MNDLRNVLGSLLIALTLSAPAIAQSNDAETSSESSADLDAPFKREIALSCAFVSECFEAESCADTTFSVALNGRAVGVKAIDMPVEFEMISDTGTTTLIGVRSSAAYSLSGGAFQARHLMTIAEGGAARYTLHYADGPMAISYLGACE